MDEVVEVKNWMLNEVFPYIVRSGKLTKNGKNSETLSENANESFKVLDVSIRPIGTDEAFMLTKCYRVKIAYTNESEEHTCILVAKKTPSISPQNYGAVGFNRLFHNEIAAYTIIIPTLMQFSKVEEKYRNFPKYFYSSLKEYEASIVLGDFNPDGWQMTKSLVNLSLEHLLLGAQHIGFFHGLCYALKTVDRKKFDSLIGLVKESRFAQPPLEQWVIEGRVSGHRVRKAVDKFDPQIPEDFLHKLEKLIAESFIYSKKRVKPIEPYATLCHGDYLRNNMAFAYGDNQHTDIPTNVMMFDFQTLRYSSPMIDVCVFFSLSAGKDIRSLHFDELFNAYHVKLISTYAKHAEGELPDFLSKSKLLKEYTQYLPYSLGIASFFLRALHDPAELSAEEMLSDNFDVDAIVDDGMNRGGDVVDSELASLVRELYELTVQEKVDVFKGFI